MLVDNSYVLQGEIDPHKFFKFEDVSKQILEKQNEVDSCKNDLLEVLKTKEEPKIIIGDKCFKPFECDFKHHCWKEVPEYDLETLPHIEEIKTVLKRIGD